MQREMVRCEWSDDVWGCATIGNNKCVTEGKLKGVINNKHMKCQKYKRDCRWVGNCTQRVRLER